MESIEKSSSMEYNSDDINELIIYYVRNRPQLWDLKDKQYRDTVLKRKLWCEVAQELNVTGMYCLKNISSISIKKSIINFLIFIEES